ncbi:Methyltransferase type 11 [Cucumis melo var. makuwa]|uniref:Methyltransferase type 11 n=1 Tax=Cucumis melo var. makuwa TaxID=1194695 RepID=A0A5D3B7W5_CUCMM|nr:Methyltransferase type 11 [Cucumis melo var. makuwa]
MVLKEDEDEWMEKEACFCFILADRNQNSSIDKSTMERHIRHFLNKLSFASIAIATLILIFLFLQTPQTCIPLNSPSKPHHKFPKSCCDSTPRELVSIDKKNKCLLHNHTKVICVSTGAGHEVMALSHMGVHDVTGVELIDSPPLVSRADPHNLPFFDHVFDLAFTAHLAEALFPSRFVSEMERDVRPNGVCVIVVKECGDYKVKEIVGLFMKSRFVNSINVTLT